MSGSTRDDIPIGSVHFGQESGDEKPNEFAKKVSTPATTDVRLVQAAMLLMREVLCEQVFRQMQQFKSAGAGELTEHPCRSLKMRDITPERLELFVSTDLLLMSSHMLKARAAEVLDAMESR